MTKWVVYVEPTTGRFLAGDLNHPRWVNLERDAHRFWHWRDGFSWLVMNDVPTVFMDAPAPAADDVVFADAITAWHQVRTGREP
jgi:hypothetical protein